MQFSLKTQGFSSYVLMEFSLSFQAKHFDIMDVFQNFEPRASNEIASDQSQHIVEYEGAI